MFYDPTYLLIVMLPTLLLSMYAQWKVRSAFGKWDKVPNERGITGGDTARAIMQQAGLENVGVARTPGQLTDHYDPRSKTIHLSDSSTGRPSVAAMAIVAHELGHAEQDKVGNAMLNLRASLVPVAKLGTNLGVWLIIGGLIFNFLELAWLGVLLFGAAVAFTLVTLPVELDASRRAKKYLRQLNLVVSKREEDGVDAVLNAAALTYVAAAATAVLNMVYWVSILSGRRRS